MMMIDSHDMRVNLQLCSDSQREFHNIHPKLKMNNRPEALLIELWMISLIYIVTHLSWFCKRVFLKEMMTVIKSVRVYNHML